MPTINNLHNVYLIDGSRTPFLRASGKPGAFRAADLAVAAGKPLLARQPFAPSQLDEVILGCVAPGVDEANIGRVVSLRLGCGDGTPAWTVSRNCASGMQALDSAASHIALGRSHLVLAGGTEAMSHTPVLFSTELVAWLDDWRRARGPLARATCLGRLRPRQLRPVIGLLRGLTDPVCGLSMGQTAEKLAHRFAVTRTAMDEYAVRSHERLARGQDEHRFEGEIEPLYTVNGDCFLQDDGVRRDSSMQKLARLRPVFDRPAGQVTAGNSAQITDGCAWLILASEQAVERYQLQPRAQLIDSQWAGLDPTEMGLGPVHASTPLITRQALTRADIDYWEINEAFAGQVLACLAAWQCAQYCRDQLGLTAAFGSLDPARLNADGGGISMGHPVGASGARIVLHALRVLEQNQWRRAVATLCIGGGQGGAMLIERIANS